MRTEATKFIFDDDPLGEFTRGDPLSILYHNTNRRSTVGYVMAGIQVINLCLQALLLTLSLLSIAYQVNESAAQLAITIPVLGVGLLALTGIVMLLTKRRADAAIRQTRIELRRRRGHVRTNSDGIEHG